MSHRLDRFFKEKAEQATFPYKEEYKEEAAALWDRLEARKRYRRWGLVILLLLLGLISGLVWYAIEKEGNPAASEPIALEQQSTHEEIQKDNTSNPLTDSKQTDARKNSKSEPLNEVHPASELAANEVVSKKRSSHKLALTSSGEWGSDESSIDPAGGINPIPTATDGFTNSEEIPVRSYAQSSAASLDRISPLQPISSTDLKSLHTEGPGHLARSELRRIPRDPMIRAGAGGIVSSNQYGSKIEASAGLPIGDSFFAGLGMDLQRIHSNDISDYETNQVYYDLGVRSSRYDISFGPRYELSAHAWLGWTIQRHLITAGFGAGKVLALSSEWKIQHDFIASIDNFSSLTIVKSEGNHWIELGEVKVQPFAELSYAYAITPRLSLDVSYRRYFNPDYERDHQVEGAYKSGDGVAGAWSDDPNRFSVGIQYQIN